MTPASQRMPNLFIVGAPKCGTTSLAYWLGQHREVFAPQEKEPGFFGSDLVFHDERIEREKYLDHYSQWGEEQYALDATPAYLVSQNAAQEIAEYRPDARIIIALRNPVTALHSNFHHARFRLTENLDTVEEALAAEPVRKQNGVLPRHGCMQSLWYTDIYHYRANIERYFENFPASQIHLVLTDDIARSPAIEMNRLFSQLGLSPVEPGVLNFAPQNESGHSRSRLLARLAIHPPGFLKLLVSAFPKTVRLKARALIRKVNTRSASNPPLSDETRAHLEQVFEPDIRWLEQLLGRDLGHWTKS